MRIPVIDRQNRPLMPTTPARARKWIAAGKAIGKWSDCGQFYVQLTIEPSGYATGDIVIGIDPGKLYSGIGVQSAKFTLYTAHLILPFKTVRDRMDARRLMRRGRRGRRINRKVVFSKRAHRQQRFSNRRHSKLAPSIRANRQLELRIVSELCKLYPVAEIRYEYVRADVDLTSGRKQAKPGKGFSAVMIGQRWMLQQLQQFAPVVTIEGWQTSIIRDRLRLIKDQKHKSEAKFETHAIDGVAIAASHFLEYRDFQTSKERGRNWFGKVEITSSTLKVVRRPPYSRRQLHLMVPASGGLRRKYGGSTTRHGVRKGDLVNSPKGIGYVSGDTEKQISVSDTNWKRLGRIAASKVTLIRRSNGLVVASTYVKPPSTIAKGRDLDPNIFPMTAKKPRKSLGDTLANNFVYGDKAAIPAAEPLVEQVEPIVKTVETVVSRVEPIVKAVVTEETSAPVLPQPQPPTSLMSRLIQNTPEKEPTVRLTVDLPQSMHKKLSILCANTGMKKVEVVRMLLDDALKNTTT